MPPNISKTLFVFQTSRQVQNFLFDNQNIFVHVCSFSDFIDKVALVEGRAKISNSARLALLRSSALKVDMGRLGFERSFLDFLSHSDFLFSFFEELRGEQKSIDDIRGEDIYAAFEDHLGLLEQLFASYKAELERLGVYDLISVDEWIINTPYLQNFDEIVVESMGLFTAFELSILEGAAREIPLRLVFTLDEYNRKMAKKFELVGVDVGDARGKLHIDLSAKKLISADGIDASQTKITAYRLKNRAYEAAFAMSKIADFVAAGYEPERIAIVLPDEGYAPVLRLFDRYGNLNFAFGEPLSKTKMYAALAALLAYCMGENVSQKLESMSLLPLCQSFDGLYEHGGFERFAEAMDAFLASPLWDGAGYEVSKEIIRHTLYDFAKESFVYESMRSAEVGQIFISALGREKLDDIGGGRIKVIGALESRVAELDAVVTLDMNEEFFPKKIDKDLFLNTKIKERAGMPTVEDRQNLQKHFFYEMMRNVKECAFAFVENDEAAPSPFLFEIDAEFVDVDEESLEELYFDKKNLGEEEPIKFDNTQSLYRQYLVAKDKEAVSVSAFCDFLACDKLFYLKHIMGLRREELGGVDESAQEIGSALHKAFEIAFDPKNGYEFDSAETLKEFVKNEALKETPHLAGSFDFMFALRQLDAFCEEETRRGRIGHKVFAVEMEVKGELDGVAFEGRIDRMDEIGHSYALIDYKTGKTQIKAESEKSAANSRKYQLALYTALLLQKGFEIEGAYYYDVLRGALVGEKTLETKLSLLPAHIERFTATPIFAGTSDKKNCRYCDFADICGVHGETTEEEGEDE
ncbi:MAG: PD-(D/E)XK nuclease family protein [Campylobacterales bacterium]